MLPLERRCGEDRYPSDGVLFEPRRDELRICDTLHDHGLQALSEQAFYRRLVPFVDCEKIRENAPEANSDLFLLGK